MNENKNHSSFLLNSSTPTNNHHLKNIKQWSLLNEFTVYNPHPTNFLIIRIIRTPNKGRKKKNYKQFSFFQFLSLSLTLNKNFLFFCLVETHTHECVYWRFVEDMMM